MSKQHYLEQAQIRGYQWPASALKGNKMDLHEKEIFINDLISTVKGEILNNLRKYPEKWDGIELRWLIKEKFNQVVFGGYEDKRQKRFKDFENKMIVNNW